MEKAMRKVVLLIVLLLVLSLISFSSFGTRYRSGSFGCANFEEEEKAYMEQLHDPNPYVSVSLVYALCLLLKGEVTKNQDDVSKGMLILHGLADQHSNIVANYWIAEYYFLGGDFVSIDDRNLDLAVKYYSRTLAIIKTYNSYPPLKYIMWEETNNIEMEAYYMLPLVYLTMFYKGVTGDYQVRLLNSPSYEGDRDVETYPEYRDNIMGYINLAIEHAGNCKNLPLKRHFDKPISSYYIKVCAMYEEKAKLLKKAYVKSQFILNQDRCKDIGSDETVFAYCPEIDEATLKIVDTYDSIFEEAKEIFYPIRDLLVSASNSEPGDESGDTIQNKNQDD